MKVLLINPNIEARCSRTSKSILNKGEKLPPLGLAYLGAVLEKESIDVEIFDNYLFEKPLNFVVNKVKKLQPDIVGITSTSVAYQDCVKTAKAVKKALPSTYIVIGGPHPTILPDTMLKHPEINFVVLGEGEYTFRELALRLDEGKNVENVKGLMYIKNEKIFSTGCRPFIQNLDELPLPSRHLLPMSSYPSSLRFLDFKTVNNMNTSRGCPYRCSFCSVKSIWGRGYRSFGPKRIVDEIEHLVNTYGTEAIYFREDNFTVQKKRVIEVCSEIRQRSLDIEWICESRVDLISRDLLRVMKKAGCRAIWFGVESGSQRILNLLKKDITVEKSKKTFRLCREEGIKTGASFMIGIPSESFEDMEMTLKLAYELNPDFAGFNIFMGIPGSQLYTKVLSEGLYDYIDENYIAYIKTEHFDFEKMKEIEKNFLRRFNFKPQRIIRTIKQCHWRKLPELTSKALKLLRGRY